MLLKYTQVHILGASLIGIISALAMHHLRKNKSPKVDNHMIIINQLSPILDATESGRAGGRLERFSHYVARQLGFKDESECPGLCELVQEYLKRSKGCDDGIFEYFANEEDAESLYVKLENELERCILAYFAFHWSKASILISQVLSVDSEQKRLKDLVLAATSFEGCWEATTTINPVYSHSVESGEGKIYAVHIVTSEEVERLFPIDPRLKIKDSKQGDGWVVPYTHIPKTPIYTVL